MSLPPATAFRPLLLRAANRLFPMTWDAGLLPPPDLREATLDDMAVRATGLRDFGDDSFARSQLQVLLPALREEARLTPMGRVIAHGSLLKTLKERLWAEALWRRYPEIAEAPLAEPIVIVGHMRSGTTRLQRLLASNPRFTALRLYEAMSPVPWPSSLARRGADPRIAYTRRALKFLNHINAQIAATHPTGALEIDEELGLFDASFTGSQIEAQRRIPSFARYSETVDATPAYRHLRRLLQLASWWRGGERRPFVLKTPQHLQDLPALLAVFPGAKLIFTHRDPVAVVASSASMIWNQMVVQSDDVDPHWIGAEWLHKTRLRTARAAVARKNITQNQQFDMRYADIEADWSGAMTRLHGFLGMPFDAPAHAAMTAYRSRAAAEHRLGHHRYTLADFGLDRAEVARSFADYARTYAIPAENPAAASAGAIAGPNGYASRQGVTA